MGSFNYIRLRPTFPTLCYLIDDTFDIHLMLIGKYPLTDYPAMVILFNPVSIVCSILLQTLVWVQY